MNGIINVYKEHGVTSFHVVAQLRSMLRVRKAGHTGTLDPIAEGVLPVCLGCATKFADLLISTDKQYVARFRLGAIYDTYDITGSIVKVSDFQPRECAVRAALSSFEGEPMLTVPAFSAKKINGLRAYDLARKGEITDVGTAPMAIHKIELISYNYPEGVFAVDCGKGVYVRSIIHELGLKLGSYAAMSGLARSRCGPFYIKDALKLSDIKQIASEKRINEILTPIDSVVDLPRAVVKSTAVKSVSRGMSPKAADYQSLPEADACGRCLMLSAEGKLIAFGVIQKDAPVPIKLSKVIS